MGNMTRRKLLKAGGFGALALAASQTCASEDRNVAEVHPDLAKRLLGMMEDSDRQLQRSVKPPGRRE